MSLFLAVFFLLYGGIHFYVFLRVRAAVVFGVVPGLILATVMLLMIIVPVIVRVFEKTGLETFARVMAYTGYLWMGAIFIFFSASILIDLCRLILYLAGMAGKINVTRLVSAYGTFVAVALSATCLVICYGFYSALHVQSEKVSLASPKIPKELGTIKVVQISDVHLGLIVRKDRLERILQKVREEAPDILVATGDLVDGQVDGLGELSGPLADIKPRFGKFAITGNHEYFAGISNSLTFFEKAGFVTLRGEGRTIPGIMNLAGVDDITGMAYHSYVDVPENLLLSELPRELFTILLKHRPVVNVDSSRFFDLQLSGHVHQGQIFPFRLITRLFFKYIGGTYPLEGSALLHVSRGSGTWGPPVRFLAPPEVTVIELSATQ